MLELPTLTREKPGSKPAFDSFFQQLRPPCFLRWFTNGPSRLFWLGAVFYGVLTWIHISFLSPEPAPGIVDVAGWLDAIERAWTHNDSVYFLHIAQDGYTTEQLSAFFPLYPLCIHLVAWLLGMPYSLAALMVSWGCTWGSYQWFFRLAEHEYGPQVARLALLALACYPVSVFSFASYSEALFLLVSIGAVERARAGQPWQADILGALAMLCRSTGLLLLVPLAWELLRSTGWPRRISLWLSLERQQTWLKPGLRTRSTLPAEEGSSSTRQTPQVQRLRRGVRQQALACPP